MNTSVPHVRNARISLISGTKAQFIKMMPVAWELERRGIPHRLIDTGQHETISAELRREYNVRPPDHTIDSQHGNVNTIGRGITWLSTALFQYALSGARCRRSLFGDKSGIALVHGDTASTVLGAVIAKRAGQKVMHIEAGLRSWNRVNPFPEELIRIGVMRLADYLIAPSSQAYKNLVVMRLKGRAWRVRGNTLLDVVGTDLKRRPGPAMESGGPYAMVTIHRMETLYNHRRLESVVNAVIRARKKARVLFIQHAPTARRLEAYRLTEALRSAGVELLDLMDHARFVHVLAGSEFIITDGGSVQEEAGYLGVPCLLMRKATERDDGLEANVVLSRMDEHAISSFIDDYESYRRPPVDFDQVSPSAEIVDILESLSH